MTHFIEKFKTVESPELTAFRKQAKDLAEMLTEASEGGSRNERLNKAAFLGGLLVASGEAEEYFVVDTLETACDTNGYAADYGDSEVTRIIDSGMSAGIEAYDVPDSPEDDDQSANPFYQLAFTSEELKQLPAAKWTIDGIVLENSLVVIFGAPGSGKSFLALDMVGCLANRNRWVGHDIGKNLKCLYLLGEGASGLPDRVEAWEKHNGMKMNGVSFIPRAIQVGSKAWDKLVDYASETKPGLVVIDTLARMSGNMEDENNATQMGKFIRGMDALREATGGSVLVVHHANRQGGIRGSNALDGAADTMIRVDKEYKDTVEAFITKVKEGETGDLGTFRFKSVGKSCVLANGTLPWSPTPITEETDRD